MIAIRRATQLDALPLGPRVRGWREGFGRHDTAGFVAGEQVVGLIFVCEAEEEPGVGEVEAPDGGRKTWPRLGAESVLVTASASRSAWDTAR